MNTVVKEMSKEEVEQMLEENKAVNRLTEDAVTMFERMGWTVQDYSMEKRVQGYVLTIEFCVGDFCVSIASKRNKWLLEDKKSCRSFLEAWMETMKYEKRIMEGEHWNGEND